MQPFEGIKVIDFTHVIAGPFCAYQLGVLGADVIKIESVDAPDMLRYEGEDVEQAGRGYGMTFLAQSANKRAIAIDLKTEKGQVIARQLAAEADVVIENYRSGALNALGLGYEALKAINPTLIYCSLTGFGQEGELGQRTAYDNVIQAISGLMASTGAPRSGAVKVGPPVLDYGTGIQAAFAIAAALFQRTRVGKGQRIDIAMLDAALMLSGTNITYLQETGSAPALTGNSSLRSAGYGCFDTADGQLMIGAYTGEQMGNLWKILGDAEHGKSMRSLRIFELAAYIESDRPRIADLLLKDSALSWEKRLNAGRVPAAAVRAIDETLAMNQLTTRNVTQQVATHRGQVDLPMASFSFEHGGPALHSAPPLHGEHSRDILSGIGYSDDAIEKLEKEGVVRCHPG